MPQLVFLPQRFLFPREDCYAAAVVMTILGTVPNRQTPLLTCLTGARAACGFVLGAVFAVEQADGSEELGVEAA